MSTGGASDTISFTNSTLNSAKFQGGTLSQVFTGGIVLGTGGVSFYGGDGKDTFNFSSGITGSSGGTAYFWNDTDAQDSIILGSVVSSGNSASANALFVVTEGATTVIDFSDSQALENAPYSNMFGVATDLAAGFVSSVVGTDMITLTFGTTATMGYSTQPGKFVLTGANAESITTSFSGYNGTTQTGLWGGATTIPSFS